MKKHIQVLASIFIGASSFAQQINDPGITPEASFTETEINSKHVSLEGLHASPIIATITPGGVTNSSQNWPQGTWHQGYYNTYNSAGYSNWYENSYGNHPLIREASKYTLGYLHGDKAFPSNIYNSDFEDRAVSGIDNLVNTQLANGGFVWWRYRPGKNSPNTNESIGANYSIPFSTAYGLKALAEGYWYKHCYLEVPAEDVKAAVVKSADYLTARLDDITINGSNANERGLVAWGLATAYKATGNINYKNAAIIVANRIVQAQFPEGDWATDGGPGDDELTASIPESGPSPLDNWIVGDFDGDGKDELLQKYASTYIYLQNDDLTLDGTTVYSGVQDLEKWIVGNFDNDPEDEVLHKFVGSPYIYLWNYGQSFGTNSVYTGNVQLENWICGDFDNDQVDEVLQKYTGSNSIYLWNNGQSFGSNSIYSGNATIQNWLVGNFDNDPEIEVLQKFANSSSVYLWNFGSSFGSNAVYTGIHHIENWLASDFDLDGKDEVLQKYANSTYIYLWDHSNAFGSNSIYTGNAYLKQWIAGDFDGDGIDEVLQNYWGSNTVYEWNYGGSFNASQQYNGGHTINKWVVANIDGDNNDELFHNFTVNERIYYWNNPENCLGCYTIFNLPSFTYNHDSRMQYHFFILGGLIETYSISTGSTKAHFANAIVKAVNHIIDRLDVIGSPKMSNYYYDINRNVMPQFIREKNMFHSREAMQQLPQLAYYASSDVTNFSAVDVDRIINLANRLAFNDYPGYSYYKDYMNTINANGYLDYYGGCEHGIFKKLKDTPIGDPSSKSINGAQGEIYPNPSKGEVYISNPQDFVKAEVYNQLGELISTHLTTSVTIKDLANGVYLIKVYRNSNTLVRTSESSLEITTHRVVKQ